MHILVTNDDGVTAPGLMALAEYSVSITPLQLDLTAYPALSMLKTWQWTKNLLPEARGNGKLPSHL